MYHYACRLRLGADSILDFGAKNNNESLLWQGTKND